MVRRALALGAGAFIWGALLVGLGCDAGRGDRLDRGDAKLLPDVGGRIESVVLSLTSGRRAALRNADIVSRLVDALPAETTVRILTNDPGAFAVRQPAAPLRERAFELVAVDPARALTIWPQDPFLVLTTPSGEPRLLRSRRFERADDRVMASVLSEHAGWPVVDSELDFEGGNIVADERRAYVGANTIRRNALARSEPEPEIARRFEAALGRPVLVVGPLPQPIGHLDMYLTPLGFDRVLLADPGAGAGHVERVLASDPESIAGFERAVRAWFFGDPEVDRLPGADGPILAPDLTGRTRDAVRDSRALAPAFDALALALASTGLEVSRIPILLARAADLEAAPPERPYAVALDYPVVTYNNVLQETRDGRERVWLPQYGLAVLDDAAREAWRTLGYEVVPVPGYATSAMYGGALRCSAKVTQRGSPGTGRGA